MARELYSPNWDRMSFDEQREYRDRKLSYFIRTQLYPYSSYYRGIFDTNKVKPEDIRRVEDLRKLPFTYKEDIVPGPDEPSRFRKFILQPDEQTVRERAPRAEQVRMSFDRLFKGEDFVKERLTRKYGPLHMQFTTGRTGFPTPIMYARDDLLRMAEAGRRILELVGYGSIFRDEKAVVVNAMPFAPHLGFWMVAKGLERAGVLSLNSGGGRILGTHRIMAAVESLKATGIVGIPGYVYHVLRTASEEGRDFSSVRIVLVAGERVPPGMKEALASFLESMGAEDFYVLSALGFTEARKGYSECVPGGDTGYHLYPDLDYIELVDPDTGEPVAEGEDGELVYSCLEGQGTCVIRFRTGDIVKGGIEYDPCPSCGRKVPRLGSDISRSGKTKGFSLTKVKGTLVDQGAYYSVLNENPDVEEWQVEIQKRGGDPFDVDVVDVFVVAREGTDTETLQREIESQLTVSTEVTPDSVRFLSLKEMVRRISTERGLKELKVVDRRPKV